MISPTNFQLFISNGNVMLGQAYSAAETFYNTIASTIPSSTDQEIYGWTGRLPKPRQWNGPRIVYESNPQTYVVVNEPWESTLGIDRFKLDDDKLSIHYRDLPELALQAARLPDFWIRDLIEASNQQSSATRQLCTDGLSFFNTSHPQNLYAVGGATFSNDLTGGGQTINGTLVGGAFSVTAVQTLREYMGGYKAEDGEPMLVKPNMLMVPLQLATACEFVLKSMSFAPPTLGVLTGQVGAMDNPIRRWAMDFFVNPYLASATKWYMMDLTKSIKPLIWQLREPARLAVRTNEDDPVVFDTHKYVWGYWGRGAPAFAFPWLCARSGS